MSGFIRLISFTFTVVTFVHIVGCLWLFIAKLDEFNPDTWVVKQDLQDQDNFTIYMACIYWAFTTLLTVGYGDISAYTNGKYGSALLFS